MNIVGNSINVDDVINNVIGKKSEYSSETSVFSKEKYRRMLNDEISSDEQITKRINFLKSLCRNIIKLDIEKLYEQSKKTI
ncbi:MAG: hypothetical protein WCT42_03235 [Candidatus Paceibacterota bacterium]|jgi:hypothetical protein